MHDVLPEAWFAVVGSVAVLLLSIGLYAKQRRQGKK